MDRIMTKDGFLMELTLDISDVNRTVDEIQDLMEKLPDIPEDVERDIEKACLGGGDAFAIRVRSAARNVVKFETGYLLADILIRLRKRVAMYG